MTAPRLHHGHDKVRFPRKPDQAMGVAASDVESHRPPVGNRIHSRRGVSLAARSPRRCASRDENLAKWLALTAPSHSSPDFRFRLLLLNADGIISAAVNAIVSIDTALPRAPFEIARDAVATWRGRCLDVFARTELAVSETLLVLAAVDGRGKAIKLPHLVGQRYDSLAAATGPEGNFAEEGKVVANAVLQFKEHDSLRSHLTHGVFTVTLDHRCSWHLVSHLLSLRAGRETRDLFVTQQEEAASLLRALEKNSLRLRSNLGQLRARFRRT
ncbi:hypothetical protein KY084_09185 [Stakelama sp. CBK3Z-3]|uniref:Uncharacterized protein n=1 Tax=Stakelama flava TaxID=2860338 RepID=A0ABS6XLF4_9SPHN|nr:hypothetical protein [Stakelama flava]MBW4331044.1 hypothetical protein [Stakelama flava]